MNKRRNNLCGIDREEFTISFQCGGRTDSLSECGFFKPDGKHSEVCVHLTEFVPLGSEYPEYKYYMCSCADAQNKSLREMLDRREFLNKREIL